MAWPTGPSSSPTTTSGSAADQPCSASTSASPVRRTMRPSGFFLRAAVGDFDLEEPRQLIGLLVGMARNKLSEQVKHHQRQRRDVRRTAAVESDEQFTNATEETPSQVVAYRELLQKFREQLT